MATLVHVHVGTVGLQLSNLQLSEYVNYPNTLTAMELSISYHLDCGPHDAY